MLLFEWCKFWSTAWSQIYFADNIFTLDVMDEPVIATDGFTYEKRSEFLIIPAATHIHLAIRQVYFGMVHEKEDEPHYRGRSSQASSRHTHSLTRTHTLIHCRPLNSESHPSCPNSTNLIPNHSLKSQINQWRESRVRSHAHLCACRRSTSVPGPGRTRSGRTAACLATSAAAASAAASAASRTTAERISRGLPRKGGQGFLRLRWCFLHFGTSAFLIAAVCNCAFASSCHLDKS